uniref:uncharacterized protein LOC120342559 isoform X1 n=1 Tax=Styela clava TaxID=7725 RepID=UPI0019392B1C|nr:uncharacterized protein LOC120342559 isoform X1 [Styela clava]
MKYYIFVLLLALASNRAFAQEEEGDEEEVPDSDSQNVTFPAIPEVLEENQIVCYTDWRNYKNVRQACPVGEICQTKVEFHPRSDPVVYKECKTRFACNMNRIINQKQCEEGVTNRVCHHCCYGDDCNSDTLLEDDGIF